MNYLALCTMFEVYNSKIKQNWRFVAISRLRLVSYHFPGLRDFKKVRKTIDILSLIDGILLDEFHSLIHKFINMLLERNKFPPCSKTKKEVPHKQIFLKANLQTTANSTSLYITISLKYSSQAIVFNPSDLHKFHFTFKNKRKFACDNLFKCCHIFIPKFNA